METEVIGVAQKAKIKKVVKIEAGINNCCGGAPLNTEDACCKLDEDKKAEGQGGCGCNTVSKSHSNSACC